MIYFSDLYILFFFVFICLGIMWVIMKEILRSVGLYKNKEESEE